MKKTITLRPAVIGSAIFSPCRTYRYALTREWAKEGKTFAVVGLNPSTANETDDDPTIRKCMHYARREGCARLVMVNLFAYRATHPPDLLSIPGTVLVVPDNIAIVARVLMDAEVHVAAWGGVHKRLRKHIPDTRVLSFLRAPVCLGTTQEGYPLHPLYRRNDTPLVPWSPPAV